MHNTEDKKWWVISGREKEDLFVEKVCPNLKLPAIINPEKRTNPYAPDLLVHGKVADLKCQETPFFKADICYGIPNQYAVTFNHKDYSQYLKKCPSIMIYFWIHWKQLSKVVQGKTFSVRPMTGVWVVEFQALKAKIEKGQAPLHTYQKRVGDTIGNATKSYVFDVRKFNSLYLRENDQSTRA